jgi:ribosomal protein S18 acetylase RimI-like enzyme
MSFSCRRLALEDAAAFREVRLRSLREHPDMFLSTPEDWDLDRDAYEERLAACPTFGAFADGRLVGVAVLGVVGRTRPKERHKCEVWSVYTAPEARGRGVARAVMRLVIAEAGRRGYEALVLCVASHNEAARRLYASLGFVRFGTEPGRMKMADGRSIDEDLLQLRL